MDRRRLSKLLSLVLRHDPERFGVHLDREGWADVGELISHLAEHGVPITRGQLEDIATPRPGEKHRFELEDSRVRARYGHSVDVDLDYTPATPPRRLFHGTPARNVAAIRRDGISPMSRRSVHLSQDVADAVKVGARHGRPVVLEIDTGRVLAAGLVFHRLPGGVWLVDRVPPDAIVGDVSPS